MQAANSAPTSIVPYFWKPPALICFYRAWRVQCSVCRYMKSKSSHWLKKEKRMCSSDLKGTVQPQKKNNLFFLFPVVLFIHLHRFWWELQSFGDVSCGDVCLLLNRIEVDCTQLRNSTAIARSRNHNQVTRDNPQTLLWAPRLVSLYLGSHDRVIMTILR